MIRVPIAPERRQRFTFRADVAYQVELAWNTVAAAWFITIDRAGVRIVTGHRVSRGVNLLAGAAQGALIALDAAQLDNPITYTRLVQGDARLYYFTPQEVAAA